MTVPKRGGSRGDRTAVPRRVVALGGGTGLPMVLAGLRSMVGDQGIQNLVAIVTMTDDGGSSGRLRKTRGVPPPGDIRNCLVALASEQELLSGIFQHRYGGDEGIGGHSLGNLILTALAEQTGSFLKAVETSSKVLRTVGRILPATLRGVALEAEFEDGGRVVGETAIVARPGRIKRIRLQPSQVEPTPGVVQAIREADLVVLGPGSLYTSQVPHLLVHGVARALRETGALRVMVGNLVSEHGEAADLDLLDHVRVMTEHAGGRIVDRLLVNSEPVDVETCERYRNEGAIPLYWTGDDRSIPMIRRNLLGGDEKLRHDPVATANGLLEAWADWNSEAGTTAGEEARTVEERS
ncbi:MAG: uridine diphosphate-N-acetylglucosamine-binding protein YvcK [Acidobacteria bacterium]|uniref:Putative gluconeogenesis factor n=1 Tax=Candidatus Polarisedimenticola svalbardensis TaxID=2886004 RepID=A0A8J6Y0I0_9BACT|nr:uridine diphosphate-N-acetylglucosamine-binding protein YvcK [Candidatus Polarisedimenticola svalbardensis]